MNILSRIIGIRAGRTAALAFAASWVLLFPAGARADSGTLTLIDGFYTNAGSSYVLGGTGSSNQLVITNGGWLENATAFVGNSPAASGNAALVTGSGSRWQSSSLLYFGHSGPDNLLLITNGGRASAPATYVGYNAASSGNTILVAGPGSRFESGNLTLGYFGSGNRLHVSGGAALQGGGFDAVGYGAGTSNNLLTVDGAGTAWFSGFQMQVGSSGAAGNQLRVTGGAQVYCSFGAIGSGSGNSVELRDAGSLWQCFAPLYVGNEGGGNLLLITNGARAICTDASLSGNGNRLVVAGNGAALLTSTTRGQVVVGSAGAGNQLLIQAGGSVTDRAGYVFGRNTAAVTGAGALWQNAESLLVGEDYAPRAQLLVADGGRVITPSLVMAGDQGRLDITGPGALVDDAGIFTVGGELGLSNQLFIADGGVLNSASSYVGGRDSSFFNSDNIRNSAVVTGPGSVWRTTNDLAVGVTGSSSSLTISNGAQVHSRAGFVAFYGYSGNNTVTVTGTNSLWTNRSDLFVGHAGYLNRLVVSAGARLAASNAAIGRNYNVYNTALVTDPGSQATFSGNLIVGNSGSFASLTISNAARVTATSAAVDAPSGAVNPGRSNAIVITGTNSLLSVAAGCAVGTVGSVNSVSVRDGATLAAGGLQVGGGAGSFSNFVLVVGAHLTVTNAAANAQLGLANGALHLTSGTITADRLTAGGPGSVLTFQGGSMRLRSATVANGQPFIVGSVAPGASLVLLRAAHSFADGLLVPTGASLTASGTLAATVTNHGSFFPGESIDSLVITRDLHLGDTAKTLFEIGGATAGTQFDFLQVSNTVRFGGELRLTLVNGFVPASNAVLTLASFAASLDTFSNAPNGARVTFENSIVSCRVDYTSTSLRLSDFHNAAPVTNLVDDNWANQYFGHSPLTPAELAADPDGDGASNLHEYQAGTNPLDPASVLRIISHSRNAQNHVVLRFLCVPERAYGMAFSTDLAAWTEIYPLTASPPSPGVCEWIDDGTQTGSPPFSPGQPRRYYRATVR